MIMTTVIHFISMLQVFEIQQWVGCPAVKTVLQTGDTFEVLCETHANDAQDVTIKILNLNQKPEFCMKVKIFIFRNIYRLNLGFYYSI